MLPKLYAILNADNADEKYFNKLLDYGAKLIQIRSKELSEEKLRKLLIRYNELRDAKYGDVTLIVNDYVEIAKLVDGVHLGQGDSCPKKARETLGSKSIIGLSTHNLEQIKNAPVETLDYLALGPIFHSNTKSGHAPVVGLEKLKEAVGVSKLPIVAIGGITFERMDEVIEAGASSVAMIGELEREILCS